MNRADVQMLQGSIERMGRSFLDRKLRDQENKRYAEKQLLEEAMRERDQRRYEEQRELAKAMAERDQRRLDWQIGRGEKADEFTREQWRAGEKGRLTKEQKAAIELELLGIQRDQLKNPQAQGAGAAPLFEVEGLIDPETGQRSIHSFKGKVAEDYLNTYQDAIKQANAAPELQPNPVAKKPGFFQRMRGKLPPNGAGTQYLNALNQSVAAGEMTQQEAEEAFAAKRAQAVIW